MNLISTSASILTGWPAFRVVQIGPRIGVRNDGDGDHIALRRARLPSGNRQADSFNRDRALFHHVAAYGCGNGHPEPPIGECAVGVRIDGLKAQERACAVDMALHHVAAERSSRRRRQLQIYDRTRRKQGEGSAGHRLRRQIGIKAAGLDIQARSGTHR